LETLQPHNNSTINGSSPPVMLPMKINSSNTLLGNNNNNLNFKQPNSNTNTMGATRSISGNNINNNAINNWNNNGATPLQSLQNNSNLNSNSLSGKNNNPQNSNAALHTRGASSGKAFDPFDNIAGLNNNTSNIQNKSNINPQQQYQQSQQRPAMMNNNNIKKF
jgi:hypothetical protein